MRAHLARAVRVRNEVAFHDGRRGYKISENELKRWDQALLRTVFNEELQHAVLHCLPGSLDRGLVLYSAEVLKTMPNAPTQERHADISTGDIRNLELQVSTIRLVVNVLISIDGPVTTEVYPRTRSDKFDYVDRRCVRATEVDNCVLFDARFAHQGAALDSPRPNLKLCLAVINADACKEHLRVVDRCLQRRTMNLRVADLLKAQIQSHEPSVQLESASSKRKAEQGAQIPKRQAAGVRGGAGLPPQQRPSPHCP